jgi:hypothetical protein
MASETKHTEGPWTLLPQNGAGPMLVHEYETGNQMNPTGYRLIAHMLQRGNSLEQDRANHNLCAAAPEMLAALKRIVLNWDGEPEDMDEAREAIAKATS